ncbi:MAG: filamentous hemagglutinin family domain-containing protein, partial [Halothiobacillaceae bacterium]
DGVSTGSSVRLNLNGSSNSDTCLFSNCIGGSGGSGNIGVNIATTVSLVRGALQFTSISGGSATTGNHGLMITSAGTLIAPTILCSDIVGGPGSGSDYGLYINGGTLGSSLLSNLIVSASSLGTGSSEIGIVVDSNGSIIAATSATVSLMGIGGGIYSGAGQGNNGIYLNSAILTSANGMTLTGIGGAGSLGLHSGIQINGATITTTSSFICSNCTGGTGGSSNYGVFFSSSFSMVNGTLQFNNVSGGGVTTNNYGVYVVGAGAAPSILGNDIYGGSGTGSDYGLYITGTLGDSTTNQIELTAGSLGTGSNEYGIYLGGSVVVNSGGTINLTGLGGGLYSSSGQQNVGIYCNGATLTAGAGGSQVNTIVLTGIGGVGSGGLHHGVMVEASTTTAINLNGTSGVDTISLVNCSGGNGGASNYGVNIGGNITMVNGTMQFQAITGGGSTTSNHGLYVGGTLIAPVILGTDIYGGPGVGTNATSSSGNIGIYVPSGGVLGSSVANTLRLTAGSLGSGRNEYGIFIGGSVTANGLTLNGTGGGLYSNSGQQNYGIYFNGGSLSANSLITLTGLGGSGTNGSNHGVMVDTSGLTVSLSSGSTSIVTFLNCSGGSGGSSGNYGVNFTGNLLMVTGTLQFSSLTGGSNSPTNYGLYIAGNVSAPIILGSDIYGG